MVGLEDLIANLPFVVTGLVIVVSIIVFNVYGTASRVALKPGKIIPLKLVDRKELSHDTRRFRFALPHHRQILGLPVGKHISIAARDAKGKMTARSYTPVTSNSDVGFVDLVIKVYFANVHPKFPDGGMLSQALNNLAIGDSVNCTGPKGKLMYAGKGCFSIKQSAKQGGGSVSRRARRVAMIAGGTGITPMLAILRHALQEDSDLEFSLLYANQTEGDILLREELDGYAKQHTRVKVWYTLDRPPQDWEYSTGFVTADMIRDHLPAAADDTMVLLCGPPPMLKFACYPALEQLGYSPRMQHAF